MSEDDSVTIKEIWDQGFKACAAIKDAEIAELQKLNVANILMRVVPDLDGHGHEEYAKSVDDVENLLSKLSSEVEDYELGIKIAPGIQNRIDKLEAAKQRELELLAVIERIKSAYDKATRISNFASWDDFVAASNELSEATNIKPSQALREHEVKMLAENDKAVSSVLVDADHLAHCAERLLAALNKVAGAKERVEAIDTATAHGELQSAEELAGEYWRAVHSSIYEYRKRADRVRRMAEERRKKCTACDGTGDVHRADGEYLGQCPNCAKPFPAPKQEEK